MRIVVMGTGPFAVPAFVDLLDSHHEVPALVTRPERAGPSRKKKLTNPMRDVAEARGVSIVEPQSINTADAIAALRAMEAELFVVCDYGQILSAEALGAAPKGGINLHGSLLPKYRGAAPVHWAILNGDRMTGVSVIHMTPRLDGGPIIATRETEIGPQESTPELETRLSELGVSAVREAIELLESWDGESVLGELQDASLVTKAPRLKKPDGLVQWTKSAIEIQNQVRAFKPWPGTFVNWPNDLRLILHQVHVVESSELPPAEPGTVVRADDQLWIATGDGIVSLDGVQPAGKRVMTAAEFLNGHPVAVGRRL